eukprot:gene14997-biopygen12798
MFFIPGWLIELLTFPGVILRPLARASWLSAVISRPDAPVPRNAGGLKTWSTY